MSEKEHRENMLKIYYMQCECSQIHKQDILESSNLETEAERKILRLFQLFIVNI